MTACTRRQLPSWVFSVWVLMSCVHCHLTVEKRMFNVTRSSLCPPRGQCGLWCAQIHGCKSFCFKGNTRINQILSDTVGNGTPHKRPSLQNRSRKGRVTKRHKETAVLFTSKYSDYLPRILLKNSSVTFYPNIREKGIVALASVESVRRILIATKYPRQVLSVSLDGGTRHVIHKGSLVQDMAVDDVKQAVFLVSKKPVIYRVSAKVENRLAFKITTSCRFYSIAVDATKDLIYAITRNKLVSVSYDGKQRQVLSRCTRTTVLTVDPHHQVLYFNLEKVLFKISMLNNVPMVVISPFDNVHRILYLDNKVYASPKFGISLKIINVKSKIVQTVSLRDDINVIYDVIFCLIP